MARSSHSFSQIVILESLPPTETHTGQKLLDDLRLLNTGLGYSLDIQYVDAKTPSEFWSCLSEVHRSARALGHTPVLHLECHGSDDQTGLVLADGTFIAWEQLKEDLTSINVASGCDFLVVLALCNGAHLVKIVSPIDRAPCWGLIGPWENVKVGEVLSGFSNFYRELLTTLDGDKAIAALQTSAPSAKFIFVPAEGFFRKVYRDYLSNHSTPEALHQRALGMQSTLSKMLPDKDKVPSVDAIAATLAATERPDFEKFKDHFFMVDLFPENSTRFRVSFDEFKPVAS